MSKIDTKEEFKQVFDQYYLPLCHYLKSYTNENALIEDLVQDVFVKLWSNRYEVEITYLKSYLFTSVKNTFLTYKRKEKHKNLYIKDQKLNQDDHMVDNAENQENLLLKQKIYNSLRHLPPKTRKIFVKNKLNGLTYIEIAESMEISVKTVEAHMTKAFKLIRENWKHD